MVGLKQYIWAGSQRLDDRGRRVNHLEVSRANSDDWMVLENFDPDTPEIDSTRAGAEVSQPGQ